MKNEFKKKLFLTNLIILLVIKIGVSSEKFLVEEIIEGDKKYIWINNGLISLKIDPYRGARIVEFIPAFSKNNWVHPEYNFGMALDNFAGEGFPGQMNTIKYDYVLVKKKDEVGAEFWAKTYDESKGVPKEIEVRKRIILKPKMETVTIKYTLTNTGEKNIRIGFMPKFDVYVSGEKEKNYYYRPSSYGLDIAWCENGKTYGEDFVKNPLQGWTGVINKNTKEGLVFLMDYNYLQWFYNCLRYNTIEWIYDRISLQPGEKWTTEVKIIPIQKFDQISYASKNLIASTIVYEKDRYIRVGYRLQSTENDLINITIKTNISHILQPNRRYILNNLYINKIGKNPVDIFIEKDINEHSGLIVNTVIRGKRKNGSFFEEEYDYYYRGQEGGGFNILTGEERKYFKKPPKKIKKFANLRKVNILPEIPRRLLEIRGLYSDLYQIKSASKIAMIENIDYSYARLSWDGFHINFFPYDFNELFKYSVVVINNIDGSGLDEEAQFMLKNYVKEGRGLLFIGGYYSFGLGGWNEFKNIEELLPVHIKGAFDLIEINGDRRIKDGKGEIFESNDFHQMGEVQWIHDIKLKESAEIQAIVDRYPFIVTKKFGKGRVAVICGTILGNPQNPFWESSSWPKVLGKLLKWLYGH